MGRPTSSPAAGITAHDHSVAAGHIEVLNLHLGPYPTIDAIPNSLPRRVTGFVDRAGDLARIEAARDTTGWPPVCVIDGMPGVGKSALVVHAAHHLAGGYPDGQLFLDLRGYTPGQVPLPPIEALGLLLEALHVPAQRLPPSLDGRTGLWRSLVATRTMLIVLDNVRSLDDVAPLLPGTGASLTLITSRHRFGGSDAVTTIPLQTLPSPDAAQLFLRNAGLAGAGTELAVTELVAGCGHLPLAINLAAAWLRKHPGWSADLATTMHAGVQIPELRGEDTHIAAAFDLSYRDLDAAPQSLFRQLGLHPGPDITVSAASALGGLRTPDARRLLEDLFDHHLVQESRPGRYQLHDLVRRFARQLGELNDSAAHRTAAVRRLLDDYLEQARSAARLVPSAAADPPADPTATAPPAHTYAQTLHWFTVESANLIACARHAADAAITPHAWAIPDAIAPLMRIRGDPRLALDLNAAALKCARDNGNKRAQARMLLNLGITHLQQASYQAARESLTTSRELFRDLDDRRGDALTLTYLGAANHQQGEYRKALTDLDEAHEVFVDLADPCGEAEALAHAGVVQLRLGRWESALRSLGRTLELARRVGDRQEEAAALTHIGDIHYRLTGDYPAALSHIQQALPINRELGDRYNEAWTTSSLGIAHRFAGNLDSAREHLAEALRIHREVGDRQGECKALVNLGAVRRLLGQEDEATALLREALDMSQAIGNDREEASALVETGALNLHLGRFDSAHAQLDRAAQIYRDIEDVRGVISALTVLGELSLTIGRPDEARRVWNETYAMCRDRDLPEAMAGAIRERITARLGD